MEHPVLDPGSDDIRTDPYPVYRWYRENCPVFRLEGKAPDSPVRYILTRYRDIAEHLRNRKLVRTSYGGAFWNRPLSDLPEEVRLLATTIRQWPIYNDPPCHSSPRLAVNRSMKTGEEAFVEELIRRIADNRAAVLPLDEPFDAIDDYANLIPAEISRKLLGLESILSLSNLIDATHTIAVALSSSYEVQSRIRACEAIEYLLEALNQAVAKLLECRDPEAPWLQGLVDAARKDEVIELEAVAPLAIQILLGGADTTSYLIGNGLYTLLQHDREKARFMETSDSAMDLKAATEIGRFESPVQHVMRHASADLEIGGTAIPSGSAVCFLLGSANRDPEFVSEPDRLDLGRTGGKTSTFGHGLHQCPGNQLAPKIATIAWLAFFSRMPSARLAGAELSWLNSIGLRGLESLPLEAGGTREQACANGS